MNRALPGLSGKKAIVTGSARGIGKEIVRRLVENGAEVIVSDILIDEGESTATEFGAACSFVPCDISDHQQVEKLIGSSVERFGRLDIMVNNAGVNTTTAEERMPIDRYPDATWHRIIDIDLTGTFYCCRSAASQMVKQNSGCIVNIASIAGIVPLRLQIGFCAAKAGIIKITEAMAAELGPLGIRTNCVSPGSTLTEATRKLFYSEEGAFSEMASRVTSFIPQRRPGDAAEIADAVAFLASDAASYVNGHNLVVDGGWTCGFSRDF